MLRRTLTILSLVGLLLSVGLWGISYFTIWYFAPNAKYSVHLQFGGVRFVYRWEVDGDESESSWHFMGWRGLGTVWVPRATRDPTKPANINNPSKVCFVLLKPAYFRIFLPLWIPTILFALVLCLTRPIYHHRRRKRKKLGLCLKCGYDLRASKERCPECGMPFPRRSIDESESIIGMNEKGA